MKHYTRQHNQTEINQIYALNSNELYDFVNGDKEIITLREAIVLDNEKAEAERKAREEAESEMDEASRILSKCQAEIEGMLLYGSRMSMEDLKAIISILDFYSDVYKDVYGMRPRWYTGYIWRRLEKLVPNLLKEYEA